MFSESAIERRSPIVRRITSPFWVNSPARGKVNGAQPVQLSDVVDRAGDPALVARLLEQLEGGIQVVRRVDEIALLAVEPPDAAMGRLRPSPGGPAGRRG